MSSFISPDGSTNCRRNTSSSLFLSSELTAAKVKSRLTKTMKEHVFMRPISCWIIIPNAFCPSHFINAKTSHKHKKSFIFMTTQKLQFLTTRHRPNSSFSKETLKYPHYKQVHRNPHTSTKNFWAKSEIWNKTRYTKQNAEFFFPKQPK